MVHKQTGAVIKTVSKYITCDICQGRIQPRADGSRRVEKISLRAKVGTDYGDDGQDLDIIRVDFCEPCFRSKVVPAIESLGVTIVTREISWP